MRDDTARGGARWLPRIGACWLAVVFVLALLLLPLAVVGIFVDLFLAENGEVYRRQVAPEPPPGDLLALDIGVNRLDESLRSLTLRVAGRHICPDRCPDDLRVTLVAIGDDPNAPFDVPSFVTLSLPAAAPEVSDGLELPVRGNPIRYPFESYELRLGIVVEALAPGGGPGAVARPAAPTLSLTLREQLPRQNLLAPEPVDRTALPAGPTRFQYLYVTDLSFVRPFYLQAMAILMLTLIAIATAYAVFNQTFPDYFISVGTLILGVWGIRAIFLPPGTYYLTAIDLCLSMVVLLLLATITGRAAFHLWHETRWKTPVGPRGTGRAPLPGGDPVPVGKLGKADDVGTGPAVGKATAAGSGASDQGKD